MTAMQMPRETLNGLQPKLRYPCENKKIGLYSINYWVWIEIFFG
jgi:hypothetical protein